MHKLIPPFSTLYFGIILFLLLSVNSNAQNFIPEGNDTIDPVSYEIHIDNIDMNNQEIVAWTEVKLVSLVDNLEDVRLDFKTLTVDNIYVNGNSIAGSSHIGGHLYIPLGSSFTIGDTIVIKVEYHGVPYHESWGGFHFSGDYAFNLGVGISDIPHNLGKSWFPCIDIFTDRAIYDIYVTVDESMMSVCGGLMIEEVVNGNGTKTQHWHCSHTLPTYLASVAIGEYIAISDTYNGAMNEDIPIDIYVRPEDTHKVAGTFINLKAVLAQFEDRMGPYPFERVGYVSTAIGAMEHASNIALPRFAINGNTSNESLIVHELTHMWLGDNVTCCSAEEMWLNEGWATFFQYYYGIELYGYEGFRESMRDVLGDVMQYCHTPGGDGAYHALNNIPQTHTYEMTAYDRGSTVVQAMRFYMGDSLFFDGLRGYNATFADQPACSYHMRDFLTTQSGIDMTGFFDNWVFNGGTPHYTIDSYTVEPVGDTFEVTVFIQNKRKGPAFTGTDNIVEIMLMADDWTMFSDTVRFSGRYGVKTLTVPFDPVEVFMDPEELMCDATTDSYKIIKNTGDHNYSETFCKLEVIDIADSAFVQVTHNWAAPDSLQEPVNGLRISDYRYWRIAGVVPETYSATAYFFYGVNGYLDNTLITGPTDSVVMLYRKDATEDWQEIEYTQLGPWNVGNLIVADAPMGEYTLAVWDTQVGTEEIPIDPSSTVKIYPNPSDGNIRLDYSGTDNSTLIIYDSVGRMVATKGLTAGNPNYNFHFNHLQAGNYLFQVVNEDHEVLISKKMILK